MTTDEYNRQVLKEIFKPEERVNNKDALPAPKPIKAIAFEDAYKYTDYRSHVCYPGYEGL